MMKAATVDKLGKLFPLLASDQDGEVVATARAIRRILEKNGSSLHELAGELRPKATFGNVRQAKTAPQKSASAPKKPAREPVAHPAGSLTGILHQDVILCANYLLSLDVLNKKSTDFVVQLEKWARAYRTKFKLTEKQGEWWNRLLVEHDIVPAAEDGEGETA